VEKEPFSFFPWMKKRNKKIKAYKNLDNLSFLKISAAG